MSKPRGLSRPNIPPRRKGPRRDTTGEQAIATAQLHAQWLELRKQGKSYRAIAAQYGVHPSTVHEGVAVALRAIRDEPAADLRRFELECLDDLIDKAMAALECGELERIEQIRKLRADRRKMLGLDAPTRVEVEQAPPTEVTLEELRTLLNSMGFDIVPLMTAEGESQ